MITATAERTALTRNIHRSRWLTELCQRADRRIITYYDSGLAGDKAMAIDACQAVACQASRENNHALVEAYNAKQTKLNDE